MKDTRDALEMQIWIGVDETGSFTWGNDTIVNLDDDQMMRQYISNMIITGLLDDAPDFIRDILLEDEIEGDDDDKGLHITIYVGEHDDRPLNYVVFIHGKISNDEMYNIVDSSILEEAIEEAKKDYIRYMAKPIKNKCCSEAIKELKEDIQRYIQVL